MLNKDSELVLVGQLNDRNITGKCLLGELREVIIEYCHLEPLYDTLFDHLKKQVPLAESATRYDRDIFVQWEEVFRILKTPKFVEDVPRVRNSAHITHLPVPTTLVPQQSPNP